MFPIETFKVQISSLSTIELLTTTTTTTTTTTKKKKKKRIYKHFLKRPFSLAIIRITGLNPFLCNFSKERGVEWGASNTKIPFLRVQDTHRIDRNGFCDIAFLKQVCSRVSSFFFSFSFSFSFLSHILLNQHQNSKFETKLAFILFFSL